MTKNSAMINWDERLNAINYEFRYRKVGMTSWMMGNTTNTMMRLADLMMDTMYEWQVRTACDNGMKSEYSPSMTFRTMSGMECMMPMNRMTTNMTMNSAMISWDERMNAKSYEFRYRKVGMTSWMMGNTTNTMMRLADLMMDTMYEWQVRTACDNGMKSEYSPSMTFRTMPGMECMMPMNRMTTNMTMNSAMISWDARMNAKSYEFRYRKVGMTSWMMGNTTNTMMRLADLMMDTMYEWQVRTACDNGMKSEYSPSMTFRTMSGMECMMPMNRMTTNMTMNSAMISWDARMNAKSYEFRYRKVGMTSWMMGNTTNTMMRLADLMMDTMYEWQVRSVCANNMTSAFSPSITFRTMPMMPMGMILNYPLNETSGTVAEDKRNDNDGMLRNFMMMPWMMDGVSGNSLQFDGVDDYIAISKLNYQKTDIEETSIALWIKTSKSSNQILVSFDRSEYFRLEIDGPGAEEGRIGWDIRTDMGILDMGGNKRIDDNKWHFVVTTFNRGVASIYVDGMLDVSMKKGSFMGSGVKRFGFLGTGSEANMMDGKRGPKYSFQGNMDEVRIYDTALSAERIQEMYEMEKPSTTVTMKDGFFLEMECGMVGLNWNIMNMPSGSGKFLQIKDGFISKEMVPTKPADRVRYNFMADKAGMYNLFFRMFAPDRSSNSFWVRVNEGNWIEFNHTVPNNTFSWYQVHDSDNNKMPVSFRLEMGRNVLDVAYREDDTRLDKAYFTMDNEAPEGPGMVESCDQMPPSPSMMSNGGVFLEAECGMVGTNWMMNMMPGGSGRFIQIQNGFNSYSSPSTKLADRISYSVMMNEAGMYNMFLRVSANTRDDNSFWIKVNEGKWIKFNEIQTSASFIWDQVHDSNNQKMPVMFRFEKGMNVIDIAYREDGTKLDKIFISMSNAMPSMAGPILSCNTNAKMMDEISNPIEDEFSSDLSINLFPNPASHELNVNIESPREELATLSILNVYGQIVSTKIIEVKTGPNNIQINTDNFANGMYLIRYDNYQTERIDRVIISH